MALKIYAEDLQATRFRAREATPTDVGDIQRILQDNWKTKKLQSACPDVEQEAHELVAKSDLPPGVSKEAAQTFLLFATPPALSASPSLSISSTLNESPANGTVLNPAANADGFVAFLFNYPSAGSVYIGDLYLQCACQRQGLGRAVVERLEARFKEQGCSDVRVAVGLKTWPSLRFWLAQGYGHISKMSGDLEHSESSFARLELCKAL